MRPPRLSAALLLVGLLALVVPGGLLAQHYLLGQWRHCSTKPALLLFALGFLFLAAYVVALGTPLLRHNRGIGVASAIALVFGLPSLFAGQALVATVPAGLCMLAIWLSLQVYRAAGARRWIWLALGAATSITAAAAMTLVLRC
jgi:hypothetical protein